MSRPGLEREEEKLLCRLFRVTFALFVVANSVRENPGKKALSRVLADTDGNVRNHAIFPTR